MATEVEIPESVSIAYKSNFEDKEQKDGQFDKIAHNSCLNEFKKVDDDHETIPVTVESSDSADNMKEALVETETVDNIFTGDVGTLHGESFPESPSDPKFTCEEPCSVPLKGHAHFNNVSVIETDLHQRGLEEPICKVGDESSHEERTVNQQVHIDDKQQAAVVDNQETIEEATKTTLAQNEEPAKDCLDKEVETVTDAFDGDEGSDGFLSAKTSLTEDLLDVNNIEEEHNEVEAPCNTVVTEKGSEASEANENEGQEKGEGGKIPSDGFTGDGISQSKSNGIESDETTLETGDGAKDAVDSPLLIMVKDKTGKEFEDKNDIDTPSGGLTEEECSEKVETPVILDALSEIESVGLKSPQEEETVISEKNSPTYVKGKDDQNENIPSQIQVLATTEASKEDKIIEYPEQTILQLDDPKEAKLETSLNDEYLKTEKSEQDDSAKRSILQHEDKKHLEKEKSEQDGAPEQTILQQDGPKEEKIDRYVDKENIEAETTEQDDKLEHTILPHDVEEHIEKKKTEQDDTLEQTILQHDEQKEDEPATYTDEIYPETAKSEQDDGPEQTILQHDKKEEDEPTTQTDEEHLQTKKSELDDSMGKTILQHDGQIEDKSATHTDEEYLEMEKSEKDDGSEKTIMQHDEQIQDKPAMYTDEEQFKTEKSEQGDSPEHINLQHDVPKEEKLEKSLDVTSETKETVDSSESAEKLNTVQDEISIESLDKKSKEDNSIDTSEITEHRVPTEENLPNPDSDKASASEELGIPKEDETEVHVSDAILDETKQVSDEILDTPHVNETGSVFTESQMLENTSTEEVIRGEISTTSNIEADQPVRECGLDYDNKPEEENELEALCNTVVTEKGSEASGAIENEEREKGEAGKTPSEWFTDDAISEPQPNDIESDETTLATGDGAKDSPDAPLLRVVEINNNLDTPSGGGLPEKECSEKVETPVIFDGLSETESIVVKSPQDEQAEIFSPKSYVKGKDGEIDDQNEYIPSQIQVLATTETSEEEKITEGKPTFPPEENIENMQVYNDEKHIEKNKAEQDDGPEQIVLQHDDPKEAKLETSLNEEYLKTKKSEQDDTPEHPILQNEDKEHFEKEKLEQGGVPAQTILQHDEPKEEKFERYIDEEQIQAENQEQIDKPECTLLPHDDRQHIKKEKSEQDAAPEKTILQHDEQKEDKPATCTDDEHLETETSEQDDGLEGTTLQHDKQKEDKSATYTDVQSNINKKEEVRDGLRTPPSEDILEPVDNTKCISPEAIEQAALSSHDDVKEAENSKEEDSTDHKLEGNYTDQSTYAVAKPESEDYQHIEKEAEQSKEEIIEEPETTQPSEKLLPGTDRDDESLERNYDAGSSTIPMVVLNVEEGLDKQTKEAKIDEDDANKTEITKQEETESLVETSEQNETTNTSEPEVVKTERGYNLESEEETNGNNSKEMVQEVLENPTIADIDKDSEKHIALEEINISSISPECIGEETLKNSKQDVEEEKSIQVSKMIGTVDKGTDDTEKQTIEEESVIKETPKVFETDTTEDTREQIKEESDSSNKHPPEAIEEIMLQESCKEDKVIEESSGDVSSANNEKHEIDEHATTVPSSLPVAEEGIGEISTECERTETELKEKVEDSHLELKEQTRASEDPLKIIKDRVDTTETLDILNTENRLDTKNLSLEDNERTPDCLVVPSVSEKEDNNEILEKDEPTIYDSENSSIPEVATVLKCSTEAEQEGHKQVRDLGFISEDNGLETVELKGIESGTREINVEPEETSIFGETRDTKIQTEVIEAGKQLEYAKSDTESADQTDNFKEPEVMTDNANTTSDETQTKNNEDPFIAHKEKSTSMLTEDGLTSQKIDTELAPEDSEVDMTYNETSKESQEDLSVPPEASAVKDISGPEDLKTLKEEDESKITNQGHVDNEVHLSNLEDHKSENKKPLSEAFGHAEALDTVNNCEQSIEKENPGVKFEATNDSVEEEKTVKVPPQTRDQVSGDSDIKEALILTEENLESVDPHHSLESATKSDPGAESLSNTSLAETSASKVEGNNDIQYQSTEPFEQNPTEPELQDGKQDIVEKEKTELGVDNEIMVTQSADETVTDAILAKEIPMTLEKVEEKGIITEKRLQGWRDAMETNVAPAGDETVDKTLMVAEEAEQNITEKRNIIEHQKVCSGDEIDNKVENSEQDDAHPQTKASQNVVVDRDGDTQVTKVSEKNDKEEIIEPVEKCADSLDAVSNPVAAGPEIAEEPQLDYKPREAFAVVTDDPNLQPPVTSHTSSGGEGSDSFKDEESLVSVTKIPSIECLGVVKEDLTMDNVVEESKDQYVENIDETAIKPVEKSIPENFEEEPRELEIPKPIEGIQHDSQYETPKEESPIPEDSTLKPQDDVEVRNFDPATSEENIDLKTLPDNSFEDNRKDEETLDLRALNKKDDSATTQLLNEDILTDPDCDKVQVDSEVSQTKDLPLEAPTVKLGSEGTTAELKNEEISKAPEEVEDNENVPEPTGNVTMDEVEEENIELGDNSSSNLNTAPVTEETKEVTLEGCQLEDKLGEDLNDNPKPIADIEIRQEGGVENLKLEENLDSVTQIPVLESEDVRHEHEFVEKKVTAEIEEPATAPDAVIDQKDDSVNELDESVRSLLVEEPNVELSEDKIKNEYETVNIKEEGMNTEKSSGPKTTEEACSYDEAQIQTLEHDNEVHLSNLEDHKSEHENPLSEASGHVEALDTVNNCEQSVEKEDPGVKFKADTNDSVEEEKTVEVPPETRDEFSGDSDTKEALILNEENLESVDPHHSLESATESDPGAESPNNTSLTETSATKVEGNNDIQYQSTESFEQNPTEPEFQDGEQDIVEKEKTGLGVDNETMVTQSADETVTDAILPKEIPMTLEKVEEKEIITEQRLQGWRDAMETNVAPAGDETVDEVENSDPTSAPTLVPDDSSLQTKSSHLEIEEHQSEQDDAHPLTEASQNIVVDRDGDTQVTKVSEKNDKEEIIEPVEKCVDSLDAVSNPVAAGPEIAEEPQLDYKPREAFAVLTDDPNLQPPVTSHTSSGGEGSDSFKDEESLDSVTKIPLIECLGVVKEDLTMDNVVEKGKDQYVENIDETEINLPVEKSIPEKIEEEPEEDVTSKIEKGKDENINVDRSFGTMASDVTCLKNEEPRELKIPKPIEGIQHDSQYESLKEESPIPEDSTLKPQDDVEVRNFDPATSEENIDLKTLPDNSFEDNRKDEETLDLRALNKKDDSATTQLLNEDILTDPDCDKVQVDSEVSQTKDLPLEAPTIKLGSEGTTAELKNEEISKAPEEVEDNENVPEPINEDTLSTGNVTMDEVEESEVCSSQNLQPPHFILPLETEKEPTKGDGDSSTITIESITTTKNSDRDLDSVMVTELSQENVEEENIELGDNSSSNLNTAPATEETKEVTLEGCQLEDKLGEDLNDNPKPIADIETRQEGGVENLKLEENLDSVTQIPVLESEDVRQEHEFVEKKVTAEIEEPATAHDAVFDHKDDSVNELDESVRSLPVEEPNVELSEDKIKNEYETDDIKEEGMNTEKPSDPKTTEETCSYDEAQIPTLEHDNVDNKDSSVEKQETGQSENSTKGTDAVFEDKDQCVNKTDESVRSLPVEDPNIEGSEGEIEHGHATVTITENIKDESINKEESVTPQTTEEAELEVSHLLKGIKEWQNESVTEKNDTPIEESKVIAQEEIKHEHATVDIAENIKAENIRIEQSVTSQTREDACLSDEASRELEVSKLVEGIRDWRNESVVDKNDIPIEESKVIAQEDLSETSEAPVTALNTKENQIIEKSEADEEPSRKTGESEETSKEVCQEDELMVNEFPEEKKEMKKTTQYGSPSEELPVETQMDSITTTHATNEDTVPKDVVEHCNESLPNEAEGVKIKETIAKSDPENEFDNTNNKETEQVTRDLELDLDTSGTKYNEEIAVPTEEEAKKYHGAPRDSSPSTEDAVVENISKTNREASDTHPTELVHDIKKEISVADNQESLMESEKNRPISSELASDGVEVKEDQLTAVSLGTRPYVDESPQEKIPDDDTNKHIADETSVPADRKTIDVEKEDMEYKEPLEEPTRKIDMEVDECENDEKKHDIEDVEVKTQTEKPNKVIDIHDSNSAVLTKNGTPDLSVTNETDPSIQKLEKSFEYPSENQTPREVNTDENKVIPAATDDKDVQQKTELEGIKPEEKQKDDTSEGAFSLSSLLEKATRDTLSKAEHVNENKEQTQANQVKQAQKTDISQEAEEAKTDEDKHDEEEGDEHKKEDSGSDAPVMVEVSKDMDAKVLPKKSHGILFGVGSKMKHSISKVKKAITGKSSHSKPLSPK